jgi:hypothetical protein
MEGKCGIAMGKWLNFAGDPLRNHLLSIIHPHPQRAPKEAELYPPITVPLWDMSSLDGQI